jgi:hypothetical protein
LVERRPPGVVLVCATTGLVSGFKSKEASEVEVGEAEAPKGRRR